MEQVTGCFHMKTSAAGLALIREFEGMSLVAYRCPAGVWTIGIGTTVYPDGKAVAQGDAIGQTEAMRFLGYDLAEIESVVNRAVHVPLSQGQFDALVSLTYNIGTQAFLDSTLLQKLNGNDYQGAAAEFARWNKADGRELPGLTRRRRSETAMFLTPSPMTGNITIEKFLDFWTHFDPQNPNHRRGVWMLAGVIPPAAFSEDAEWIKTYRTPVHDSHPDVSTDDCTDMEGRVSQNFRWGEVWNYDVKRISKDPAVLANIHRLAERLEWVRQTLQTQLVVNSWRRDPVSNAACGGQPNSFHLTGLAADVSPIGVPLKVLQDWALENWPGGVGIYSTFVHLDLGPQRTWNG